MWTFLLFFNLFVRYLHLRVARPYPATSPVFHQHPESEKRYNIFWVIAYFLNYYRKQSATNLFTLDKGVDDPGVGRRGHGGCWLIRQGLRGRLVGDPVLRWRRVVLGGRRRRRRALEGVGSRIWKNVEKYYCCVIALGTHSLFTSTSCYKKCLISTMTIFFENLIVVVCILK